ncbi:probable LRR receptor-like serine/threonine-protein kinase At3g47570 isoform X1 [Rosa chinensis]|uniref:probable LRR receptor-like serine/threonine-protein kinase At3g47570 isoform X1 n=1 Tax=Rosa chinensis TaxID=74649 RepID=UPI000D08A7CC|nr:probable LRR receptor-like serine/threonine-protein kinase At3g47570 isoform X1 [Rosa chinensis]
MKPMFCVRIIQNAAYKLDYHQVSRQPLLTRIKIYKTESMGIYRFISAAFSLLCFHSCLCLTLSGNETDRLALLEIKARITGDPFGALTSWNDSVHFCQWRGVTCGLRHQRVTRLDLQSLQLTGSISPHVGNLSFVRLLYLLNNSFRHEIPPEIGRLRKLQDLQLQNNSISGEIPSNLSGCSQLVTIRLGYNFLVGRIPEELGTLSKLQTLVVPHNNLTGTLPNSFSNLSSVEKLYVSSNNLKGSIPDIFGQLTNLSFLALEDNSLSGIIPPSIFNLSFLTVFSVIINQLQGTLPSDLGVALPNLEFFGIDYNQISGPIPVSISNLSNLASLQLIANQLSGKVPSLKNLHKLERLNFGGNNHLGSGGIGDLGFLCDLTNATLLDELFISENNFGGILPQCIANLSSHLEYVYVNINKITGSIPIGIGNLVNLQGLFLSANQFSGQIPSETGKLQKLVELNLSMNSFSGNIPSTFGNLSYLSKLDLDGNKLHGSIPSSLAECHDLTSLFLGQNNLSGTISLEVIGLSSYIEFDLSQNHFTGSLPQKIGNLINLEYLDVSGNMLFGEIPASLGSCIEVEYLYMQGNFFQGTIPSSLGSLRGLKEVHISNNNLSGLIPEFLEHFEFLQSLDLSYNNLEGMVPVKGVFQNATATSVKGNNKLCGGITEFQLPKCEFGHPKKRGLSRTLKLIICLVCGLLGVSCALSFWYLLCSRRKIVKHTASDSENFLKVSYQNLLKATDGFSAANLLGMGSFGSVYKGVLEQGQTTVAVKVLNLFHPGASKSFSAECEALRNIRHRNLLKVLSVCSGSDFEGWDFKALIYEFMVNGSLEEWLHPTQTVSETIERPRSLSFSQRLAISSDVSLALDYLHHHCETMIVHCDLKPSNILLNDEMVAHVGDFGMVRFLPRTSGNQSSLLGVKGTVGYAPPEYGMGHEVWTQGGVYSYGILLLEMFTGKRPTDDMFQGTSNLHNFVKVALAEDVIEIVDPVLVHEKAEGEIIADKCLNEDSTRPHIKIEESLISILEIGMACSAERPRERPDISDVVCEMYRIRNKLGLS